MNRWLNRPLWTHATAFVSWMGFVGWFLWNRRGWDYPVSLQVNWDGLPTMWGSPWVVLGVVGVPGLLFLGLGVPVDELWARQESRKHLNVLSLLDEVVIGLLVTIQAAFLRLAAEGVTVYRVLLVWVPAGVAVLHLLAVLPEVFRPASEFAFAPIPDASLEGFRAQLSQRFASREALVYGDTLNPRYVTWLALGVPVLLRAAAGLLARTSLSGRRGIQIELGGRRDALIGSAHLERLAAVLETLSGIAVQKEVGT